MSEKSYKSGRAAQMRKHRTTGIFPSVQTNGPSTTRVVPRQPGSGTTTDTPAPPDLSRRADMWTDTDTDSDSDTGSRAITSPPRPTSGDAGRVQPTTTTTTTTIPARDGDVNRLQAYLDQHQGQPASTGMEAMLREMQDAVDAHRDGSLTDNALQRALSRLTVAEVTGAPTVPLTVAQTPTPRFGLTLDGVRLTELSQSQLIQLGNERGGGISDMSALGYILADGQFGGSMKDLADLLSDVEKWIPRLLSGEKPDGSQAAQLARMVNEDPAEQQKLQATFGATLKGVSGPQCREMSDFVNRRFPNFLKNLKAKNYVSGFVFASRSGKSQGAGLFDSASKEVHMAMMGDKAPEAFVRLFVHETGHASFQRELLGEGKLPGLLKNGTYAAEHQRLADLYTALETTGQSPTALGLRSRKIPGGKIDTTLLQNIENVQSGLKQPDIAWTAMSPDAKTFYQAWQKLRGQDGMYMIGINMGRASNRGMLGPADRQKYQANDFTEFCAESFMHLAYGDLDAHVAVMQTRPDVPDDVKQAWASAQTIAHKYGDSILG